MNFWFPVLEDMLLNEDFINSKPSDKLYYFFLLHYVNLHEMSYDGDFFKRDIDFAAALSYSEDSIRDARRKFQRMKWIDATSGFRTKRGQNVATTYHFVKWKEPPKLNEGKRFIRFPHYDFEMMLDKLNRKLISHQDMVVYCYILCRSQLSGNGETFYIAKKDLRKYTNIVKAVECVKNLSKVPVFSEKAVFTYDDDYHRMTFKLSMAADPYEDEGNREIFNTYLKRREDRAKELLEDKRKKVVLKAKERGQIVDSSQLIDLFRDLYRDAYGEKKYPDIQYGQERKLIELAEERGLKNVVFAIRQYFEWPDEKVPNPTGTKYRTLSRFLKVSDIF